VICGAPRAHRTNKLRGRIDALRLFDQLPFASGYTARRRYRDCLAEMVGELHFSRAFSVLADPLMVLAAAAQRLGLFRKNEISGRDEADTAQPRR